VRHFADTLAYWSIPLVVALVMTTGATAADAQAPYRVLHNLSGFLNGCCNLDGPQAGVIVGGDGNFYGTTGGGGTFNAGTFFRIDATGAITILHSFAGGADAAIPVSSLLEASDGNFYGVSYSGGDLGGGTVFRTTAAGDVTVLHAFESYGCFNLLLPSSLAEGPDKSIYGTLQGGGNCAGIVFRVSPAGDFAVLHTFDICTDEVL
jgi:uncharacterized repeat protein (TIGR03803 family)